MIPWQPSRASKQFGRCCSFIKRIVLLVKQSSLVRSGDLQQYVHIAERPNYMMKVTRSWTAAKRAKFFVIKQGLLSTPLVGKNDHLFFDAFLYSNNKLKWVGGVVGRKGFDSGKKKSGDTYCPYKLQKGLVFFSRKLKSKRTVFINLFTDPVPPSVHLRQYVLWGGGIQDAAYPICQCRLSHIP